MFGVYLFVHCKRSEQGEIHNIATVILISSSSREISDVSNKHGIVLGWGDDTYRDVFIFKGLIWSGVSVSIKRDSGGLLLFNRQNGADCKAVCHLCSCHQHLCHFLTVKILAQVSSRSEQKNTMDTTEISKPFSYQIHSIKTLVSNSIVWRCEYSSQICAAVVELIITSSANCLGHYLCEMIFWWIAIHNKWPFNSFKPNRHLGFLWLFDLNLRLCPQTVQIKKSQNPRSLFSTGNGHNPSQDWMKKGGNTLFLGSFRFHEIEVVCCCPSQTFYIFGHSMSFSTIRSLFLDFPFSWGCKNVS